MIPRPRNPIRKRTPPLMMSDADHERTSTPIYSFLTLALFLVTMVVLVVTGHADDSGLIIGLGVSTLPSLVAAIASERASRDIRNGVVEERARRGATAAIQEQELVTRTGPVVTTQLDALRTLLEKIHNNTETTVKTVTADAEDHV